MTILKPILKPILLCFLLIFSSACSRNLLNIANESHKNKSERFILQQEFIGWVRISYEVPSALPLPIEDGYIIYRVPTSGFWKLPQKRKQMYCTQSNFFAM